MVPLLRLAPILLVLAAACSSPAAAPTAVPTGAAVAAPKPALTPVPANVASLVLPPTPIPSPSPLAIASPSAAPSPAVAAGVRFTVTEGSEARFKVREQLAGQSLPNDAIGSTSGVVGAVVFDGAGAVVPAQSTIEVDLTTLKSDESRRLGAISNTLETRSFPKATLAIKSVEGLPSIPSSGTATFRILGDLTVHGVTLPTTWETTAEFSASGATGTATTEITFTDYKMTPPRMGPVLSIEDRATLEIDFKTAR